MFIRSKLQLVYFDKGIWFLSCLFLLFNFKKRSVGFVFFMRLFFCLLPIFLQTPAILNTGWSFFTWYLFTSIYFRRSGGLPFLPWSNNQLNCTILTRMKKSSVKHCARRLRMLCHRIVAFQGGLCFQWLTNMKCFSCCFKFFKNCWRLMYK